MSACLRSRWGTVIYRSLIGFFILLQLAACTTVPPSTPESNAVLTPSSKITRDLLKLPSPKAKVAVAVYGLRDQTKETHRELEIKETAVK